MPISWKHVKWFTSSEFDDPLYPGSGEFINGSLLIMLEKLRNATFDENREKGWPIVIHNSVGGAVDIKGEHGHSENSLHLFRNNCKAVDFNFKTDASLRKQLFLISKIGFGGIGFYPGWKSQGFHIDIRPKNQTQRWICINGEYTYLL